MVKRMLFTKKYMHHGWKTMVLNDKEIEKTLQEHRKHCLKIYAECENDAEIIGVPKEMIHITAGILFEKRALASFTVIAAKLDEKIETEISKPEEDEETKKLKEEKIEHDEEPVMDEETGEVSSE